MSERRKISNSKQSCKVNNTRIVTLRHRSNVYSHERNKRHKNDTQEHDYKHHVVPKYKSIAAQVMTILKESPKGPLSERRRKSCIKLLDRCHRYEPVMTHIDRHGYDILQHVVGMKDIDLLEYIFNREFDVALNKRCCSSLINIATSNGKSLIVQFLISHGAKIDHKSTLCYPHVKHYIVSGRGPDAVCDYNHNGCYTSARDDLMTPVHVAIKYDDLPMVKYLVNHECSSKELFTRGILKFACEQGAIKCLPFLIETFPTELSFEDAYGKNLIHFSFAKSEECGLLFLTEAMKHGLDKSIVNKKGYMKNGTVLHYIFWLENCIRFHDIVNKLFEAGFERSNLCIKDQEDFTLLHFMAGQVGKQIPEGLVLKEMSNMPNVTQDDYSVVSRKLGKERQEHILSVIKLLIETGVPRDSVCCYGEGVLHKLLHTITFWTDESFSNFSNALPHITNVLHYFLRCGMDLTISAEYCSTPMNYVVNTISAFSVFQIDVVWPEIWYIFTLFLKYGADPNIKDRTGVSNISVILTALHRWLNWCASPSENESIDKDLPIRILIRVQDLLDLFLQNGLRPNPGIMELCCKQVAILCNINYPDLQFISEVRNIFRPFFIHGVNPNTMKMITEGNSGSIVPCQLHAQFYLARSFIIHSNTQQMFNFIKIFTNTLKQPNFNSLLASLCQILQDNFNNSDIDTGVVCVREITKLKQTVRPLKILSRICVANTLSWKIEERKSMLPLPRILQEYITQL